MYYQVLTFFLKACDVKDANLLLAYDIQYTWKSLTLKSATSCFLVSVILSGWIFQSICYQNNFIVTDLFTIKINHHRFLYLEHLK